MAEIRKATFKDVTGIIALGHEALASSMYAGAQVNRAKAMDVLLNAISTHGEPRTGACMVLIAVDGKDVQGVIIGAIRPIYEVLDINAVTHLMWYVRPGVGARVGIQLMRDLHKWSDANGVLPKIHLAANTIVDPELTGRMLQMQGFKKVGYLYHKE